MIDKSLSSLMHDFRLDVYKFLAITTEKGIYFKVLETVRTFERQKELFRTGKSQTLKSKHLLGKAVDVVPVMDYDYPKVRELLWRPDHEIWTTVQEVAERCDMTWGGNWKGFPDYFHLQDR